MENINNYLVLNDIELEIINGLLDEIEDEKEMFEFDWTEYKNIYKSYLANAKIYKYPKIVVPLKKQEVVGYALKFFQSFNQDLYTKIANSIMGRKHNEFIEVYDKYDVIDYNETNELGFEKRSPIPKMGLSDSPKCMMVYMPINNRFTKEEKEALGIEATLADIYTFVHELSHMLDVEKINYTRKYLTESTAIGFELYLSEYLLKNTGFSIDAIKSEYFGRIRNLIGYTQSTKFMIEMLEQRNEKSKITNDDLNLLREKNKYPIDYFKSLMTYYLTENESLIYNLPYANSALFSPTIAVKLHNNESIVDYLNSVKKDDYFGSIQSLGINQNKNGISKIGINQLIQNSNTYNNFIFNFSREKEAKLLDR